MSFSSLLSKLASGQKLSSLEIIALRDAAKKIDEMQSITAGWVQSGMQQPDFAEPSARRIDLDVPPGNPYLVHWNETNAANMFSIATSTWTALDLTDTRLITRQDNPCVVRFDSTDPKKIFPNYTTSFIKFDGRISFNTNATGVRHVAVAHYDSSNTLIERRALDANLSIGAGSGTYVPLAGIPRPSWSPLSADPKQYFQLEVWQNSGGNLGVGGIDIILTRQF